MTDTSDAESTFKTFDNFKIDTDKKVEFSIRNVDVSIVNSIRRTIQSNVQNVAFFFDAKSVNNPDIEIIQNDSPLHNEFLSQRLSMIPIHFTKDAIDNWNRDAYSFEIDQQNHTYSFMNITSEHITVKRLDGTQLSNEEREKLFPKNPFTKHYILITKLPPNTSKHTPAIKIYLKASLGCGEKHSCFSPTSTCTYMNKIVEGEALREAEEDFVNKYLEQQAKIEFKTLDNNNVEGEALEKAEKEFVEDYLKQVKEQRKEQLALKFNTLDKQRYFEKDSKTGEPNHFVFKLESECALLPSEIFAEAIEYIISRIDKLIQSTLVIKDMGNDQFEITIHDESHTIGNLIQALLYNKYIREDQGRQISFIGYFATHPLEKTICMKIKSTLNEDELSKFFQKEALGHIKQSLEKLREEWKAASNF